MFIATASIIGLSKKLLFSPAKLYKINYILLASVLEQHLQAKE